jgi:DNA-binding NarL/FixJ family response regulator
VERINVVLVGTNNLFRRGLRRLLDPSQFSLSGEARDLAAWTTSLEEGLGPDLVVAELNGCHEADADNLRELRAAHQDLRIVVLADATRSHFSAPLEPAYRY